MSVSLWTAVVRTTWTRSFSTLPRLGLRRQSTAAAAVEAAPEHGTTLFSSLQGKVHEKTLKALTHSPFKYAAMSVVQAEILPTLPHLVSPRQGGHVDARDLLVKARTGTGKTIAFLVPAIEARLAELERVASAPSSGTASDTQRAQGAIIRQYAMDNIGTLIISPTRELASQIAVEAQKLTSHHPGFETSLFVGGVDKFRQLSRFQKGRKDILVATPGRLRDFLQDGRSGVLKSLKNTRMLILDEADTLLDMGFRADIEAITSHLPPKEVRQTLLFSATVSQGIQQIANTHLAANHLFINCVSEDTSPVHEHIPQYHTVVPNAKDQIPHIARLIFQDQLEHGSKSKVVLFLSTTKLTQLTTTILNGLGRSIFPAANTEIFELHSKLTMNARTNAANRFRRSTSPSLLITSDVSARGVDYPGVTRVIQVGLPRNSEQYVHRVGRTGRGGSQIGRGDLVLLPWELEFVRRQFSHLPLKPLSVKDFEEECKTLAGASGNAKAVACFPDIERNVSEFLPRLNESAVSETMSSMAGFYAGMTSGLRMDVNQIVEALQLWTMDGLGLARAPYMSSQFIAKLGGGKMDRGGGSRNSTFDRKREWRTNDGASARRESGEGFIARGPLEDRGWERKPWVDRGERWVSGDRANGERKRWVNRTEGEHKPWESRGDRPAYASRGSTDGGYSSRRERPAGYQGRRTRSYEARNSFSSTAE